MKQYCIANSSLTVSLRTWASTNRKLISQYLPIVQGVCARLQRLTIDRPVGVEHPSCPIGASTEKLKFLSGFPIARYSCPGRTPCGAPIRH